MKEVSADQTTIADFSRTISDIHSTINSNTKSIQEELDDHRISIDEQHEELQRALRGLDEVDAKVDDVVEKLNARIDRLQMMLAHALMCSMLHVELSLDEQFVFATLEKSTRPIPIREIELKTGLCTDAIFVACEKMQDKGIPVRKGSRDGKPYLFLESPFLEAQRRNRIIQIDAAVEQKIGNHLLDAYFT